MGTGPWHSQNRQSGWGNVYGWMLSSVMIVTDFEGNGGWDWSRKTTSSYLFTWVRVIVWLTPDDGPDDDDAEFSSGRTLDWSTFKRKGRAVGKNLRDNRSLHLSMTVTDRAPHQPVFLSRCRWLSRTTVYFSSLWMVEVDCVSQSLEATYDNRLSFG